jgi:hypothetical protein
VKAGSFYVLPHAKVRGLVETRMRDILDGREPTDVFPAVAADPLPGPLPGERERA